MCCIERFLYIFKLSNIPVDCCCNCSLNNSIIAISTIQLFLNIPIFIILLNLSIMRSYLIFILAAIWLVDVINSILLLSIQCCGCNGGKNIAKYIYYYNAVRFYVMVAAMIFIYTLVISAIGHNASSDINQIIDENQNGNSESSSNSRTKVVIAAFLLLPLLLLVIFRDLYVTWQYYLYARYKESGRDDIIRGNFKVEYQEDPQVFQHSGYGDVCDLNNIIIAVQK